MQPQNIPIDTLVDIYKETLESQRAPTGPALWSTDAYPAFLTVRREALAARMNAFIQEMATL